MDALEGTAAECFPEDWVHGDNNCLHGEDESLQIVANPCDRGLESNPLGGGWIVLTRYKHRGRCSSAVWVGTHWPPVPLSLELAELRLRGVAQ